MTARSAMHGSAYPREDGVLPIATTNSTPSRAHRTVAVRASGQTQAPVRRLAVLPLDATDVGFVKASHSGFPRRIIIGDPESFFHRPTVVRLGAQ
jgi:hypothetical protein